MPVFKHVVKADDTCVSSAVQVSFHSVASAGELIINRWEPSLAQVLLAKEDVRGSLYTL
jgi:hypothetical protein